MVSVKPCGNALSSQTANQLGLTVSFLEQYKTPKKCLKSSPIQTSVSYSLGDLTLNGTTLFVPVIATITAIYLLCNGSTTSKTFVETFTLSFQGQDALTTGAIVNRLGSVSETNNTCCGVTSLIIDDSITITVG